MPYPRIGQTTWLRASTDPADVALTRVTIDKLYTDGVSDAGGVPLLLPALDEDQSMSLLQHLDGLMLTGGGDICPTEYGADNSDSSDLDSARDRSEIRLARQALEVGVPIFGICRGLQLLNVAFGGTLRQQVQAKSEEHPSTAGVEVAKQLTWRHSVNLEAGSELERIYGMPEIAVNSLHHQGVESLADEFVVTARAADGMIEAIESADGSASMVAVQWHPEKMLDEGGNLLFEDFVRRCDSATDRPTAVATP